MKKIVFLVSGNGGNLKFFHLAKEWGLASGYCLSVIGDRECGAVDFARKMGLDACVVDYRRSAPDEFSRVLSELSADVVVTNWHKIIDEATVRTWRGRMINLHYSLLPAFPGLIGVEPIRRAYERGCRYIGPTCHRVDEGVDTGQIISQGVFEVAADMSDSITLMFRKGCLVLLDGVQQTIGETLVYVNEGGSADLTFSPPLGFDASVFSESFWMELAAL